MRAIILLVGAVALLSVCNGQGKLFGRNKPFWTDFKVTFGVNPLTSYKDMPRTAAEAVKGPSLLNPLKVAWEKISTDCLNGGAFNGFRYIQKGKVDLALLFDVNGVIAGVQMLLKKSEILSAANQFHHDKVPMFQSETLNFQEIFTLTTYFVHPDTICTGGRSSSDLKTQGTGTGLYFQDGPSPANITSPPLTREQAITEGWSKNDCFPGMGWHNFYKVEEFAATDCLEVRPVFLIYDSEDKLKAFGYVAFGESTSSRFEAPGAVAIKAIVGSMTPKCLTDLANSVKVSSMHVYFTDNPQVETCVRLPLINV